MAVEFGEPFLEPAGQFPIAAADHGVDVLVDGVFAQFGAGIEKDDGRRTVAGNQGESGDGGIVAEAGKLRFVAEKEDPEGSGSGAKGGGSLRDGAIELFQINDKLACRGFASVGGDFEAG